MKIIYKHIDLTNQLINEHAEEAYNKKLIGEETKNRIKDSRPVNLNTPNAFVAIGITLATLVAVLFSTGLYFLVAWSAFKDNEDVAIIGSFLFLAGCYYFALEMMVKNSKFYNAGVDNTLQVVVAAYVFTAFVYNKDELNYTTAFFILAIISGWLSFRFKDAFMACAAYLSFLVFLIFFCKTASALTNALLPFIIMFVSLLCYKLVERIKKNASFLFFAHIADCLKIVTLITFYAAGNFFAIKQLNNPEGAIPIGLSVFFWLWTNAIPLIYIAYGIVKKDLVIIRTGGILIAAIVFTIRYYYSVMPIETAMVIGGIILIGISYWLIKYLSVPKRSFTSQELYKKNSAGANIEALIIAQTFGKAGHSAEIQPTTFGGGTSSGGGASGNFE